MTELTADELATLRHVAQEVNASRSLHAAAKMSEPPNASAMPVAGGAEEPMMRPRVGEIVIYRARTREYQLPAIVTANVDTLDRRGVIRGHVPDITGEDHVHLNVQTCGEQLAYQEHDVPYSREPIPGTWSWR